MRDTKELLEQYKVERDRLMEKLVLMEDTIAVLRAELKRVSEELARRYE